MSLGFQQTIKTNYAEFCFIYQGVIILRQLSNQLASSVCVASTLREVTLPTLCASTLLSPAASTSVMLSTIYSDNKPYAYSFSTHERAGLNNSLP